MKGRYIMNQQIKIVMAGARGRMGSEAVQLIKETEHFELVAAVDYKYIGQSIGEVLGITEVEAPIYSDLKQCLREVTADVFIDFTNYETGMKHTEIAINEGVRSVIGTSGFTKEDVERLRVLAEKNNTGVIIAPNFALGAVLMMKFSKLAGKYFDDVEIIEMHHDQKLDAPSGTGIKTAELISEVRQSHKQGHPDEKELLKGARGADYDGIKIHSVRLPGLIAHQEVLFGSSGETLLIRHDSYNRRSFMSGVKLAVERVMEINVLVYGLDNILE